MDPVVTNQTQPTKNTNQMNAMIDNPTLAERIKFFHATLFSPSLNTLVQAIEAGYLATFPEFTSKQLRKYPPRSEATVYGHLHAQRQGTQTVRHASP